MTVCIAALCKADDEPRAVVAADRMVTLGGFIEFEHAVPKMTPASSFTIALVAGDALLGNRLADNVKAGLANSSATVAEIAAAFAGQYAEVRRDQLEEQFLIPRALDLNTFYGAHASLNPQITAMIDNQMAMYNLGVELLIAGVDGGGAHIHTVYNPGGSDRLHDIIGYAAVGSGTIHALQSMIGFGHSGGADYHGTVFRVYASKRRAEVAPGVGHDTDMAVISASGTHWLTPEELDQLREIYEDFESSTGKSLTKRLETFNLGEGGNSGKADDSSSK